MKSGLFGLVVCAAGIVLCADTVIAKPPHVIFLLIDDLGFNDIGFNNGTAIQSPHTDELCANGVRLSNYYVQHICSPTRSALMSSRYPAHTGLNDGVIRPTSPYGLPLKYTILPQELARASYSRAMVGKWHLGFFQEAYVPTSRGFESYLGYYLGAEDYFKHNRAYNGASGYDLRDGNQTTMKFNGQYSANVFANRAIEDIRTHASSKPDSPFFLYAAFQSVHGPLEAPESYIKPYDNVFKVKNRQTKGGMVTAVDEAIGNITAALKDVGMFDDALIIFSTDNGGPVESAASNYPLHGSKATLWEGGLRGAGFIHPGANTDLAGFREATGGVWDGLMHVTDWLPTLVEAAGLTPTDEGIDGKSMWTAWTTGTPSPRTEILHNLDPLACDNQYGMCGALRVGDFKIIVGKQAHDAWTTYEGDTVDGSVVSCPGLPPSTNPPVTDCNQGAQLCVFNIKEDPCEIHDLSGNKTLKDMLFNALLEHNKTVATPLQEFYPPDPEGAEAAIKANGGFWSPWK